MADAENLLTGTVEERLQALTERLTKLEQEKAKGFIGRLLGGLSGAVVLAVFLGLAGSGVSAAAQGLFFKLGGAFLETSEGYQHGYSAGAFDAYQSAPFAFAAFPGEDFKWIAQCTTGWSSEQLRAVLKKYLDDHPDSWHISAAGLMLNAVAITCPSAPDALKR